MRKFSKFAVFTIINCFLFIACLPNYASAATPITTTKAASNITFSGANMNGYVGGSYTGNVAECGFYWGTTATPTTKLVALSAFKTTPLSFSKSLSGLKPNTVYYYQAYAKNTAGQIGRGQIISFKTQPIYVTSVDINEASITLTTGSSSKLAYTVYPTNATNKNVTWTSSDSNVATVSASGELTAKERGTAKITVTTTDGKFTDVCTVRVNWRYIFNDLTNTYISSGYAKSTRPDHYGVDIISNNTTSNPIEGDAVLSVSYGTVLYAGYSASAGNYVVVKSNYTDPTTGQKWVVRYLHLKSTPLVQTGSSISAGTVIGYVGSTGDSSGPHLHFDVNRTGQQLSEGSMNTSNTINPLTCFPQITFTGNK
jgi:murein DD-endopeptidase MepM/ murein hydrolase activator NlpD